eukprot:gene22907-biopygen11779
MAACAGMAAAFSQKRPAPARCPVHCRGLPLPAPGWGLGRCARLSPLMIFADLQCRAVVVGHTQEVPTQLELPWSAVERLGRFGQPRRYLYATASPTPSRCREVGPKILLREAILMQIREPDVGWGSIASGRPDISYLVSSEARAARRDFLGV